MIVLNTTSPLFNQTVGYVIQQVNSTPPLLLSSSPFSFLTFLKGFWKFDETGAVIAYDLTLPSFADTLDIILGNQSDPNIQTQYIELICERAEVLGIWGREEGEEREERGINNTKPCSKTLIIF
jgi:hypothetical protein